MIISVCVNTCDNKFIKIVRMQKNNENCVSKTNVFERVV